MWHDIRLVSDDSHFEGSPDLWRPYVDAEFREWVPKVVKLPNGGDAWQMPGKGAEEPPIPLGLNLASGRAWTELKTSGISYSDAMNVGMGDAAQRLAEMDRDGIDAEVVYAPVAGKRSLHGYLPREAYIAVTRGYNDWLSQEYTAADPDRLLGLAILPNTNVDDAVDELRRVATMPGIRAIALANWPNGGGHPRPEDDRFWAVADELGMPLTFHFSFGDCKDERPAQQQGNWAPISTLLTRVDTNAGTAFCCTQIIVNGIFDRYPNLRFSIGECGASWVPAYAMQADTNYHRHRFHAGIELAHEPSWYVKRHFLFGMQDDTVAIRIRNEIGVQSMTWGTDFPHVASDWPHTGALLDKMFDGVPTEDARAILGGNLSKHLKLDRVPVAV
ncbi:MAG: amidohydrolase family protein [Acidimicrobiia bacterium]